MNLVKKCKHCGDFFPSKPLSLQFYCDKERCQEKSDYMLTYIKKNRYISAHNFDIYDLDRPIKHNNDIIGYKNVCRICGSPLLKKDGSYSEYLRYCHKTDLCSSYTLFEHSFWNGASEVYIEMNRKKNLKKIRQFIKKYNLDREITDLYHLISFNEYDFAICEECGKLCLSHSTNPYWFKRYQMKAPPIINIHHIIPVHTLTWDNLYLIWDRRNLKSLCPECHHRQDHYLSTKTNEKSIKITEFM